jgi:glutaredoxin
MPVTTNRGRRWTWLLSLLLLLPAVSSADIVVLKDGTRFLGVVTHNGEDGVAIRSGGNDWAFWRRDVASVRIDRATQAYRGPRPQSPAAPKPAVTTARAQDARVVVYGTGWCGYCEQARAWFRAHQIPFEDRDIDQDPGARQEMQRKCTEAGTRYNGSIPVIDVNGTIIHGFDVRGIETALRTTPS